MYLPSNKHPFRGPGTGVFILNIKSYFNATWFLVLAILYDAWQRLDLGGEIAFLAFQ